MKRILIPTDFSINAYNALLYATQLFKGQPCHFFILNTFEVNTPIMTSRMDTSKGNELYQKLQHQSNEGLEETYHKIIRDTEDTQHTFETLSVSKKLPQTMIKTIQKKQIDFVVMGTQGASGVKGIFMGSNAIQIIKKVKTCPLLMIPLHFNFVAPVNIAFASHFKIPYGEKQLQPLKEIAMLFKASVKILHIHKKDDIDNIQEYHCTELTTYFEKFNCSLHWIEKSEQKFQHILDFIDTMNIDMLAMIYYQHSLIARLTRESVIKKIGAQPSIPFLVLPSLE